MFRRPVLPTVLLLVLAVLAGRSRAGDETDPLGAALASPPATGLLLTSVFDGSQVAKAGLRPGDVVVRYAGMAVPTLEALGEKKQEMTGEGSIPLVYVRGGKEITVSVKPGTLGFNAIEVVKGKAVEPLPPESGAGLDFSSLADRPIDSWYDFYEGGKKTGYEHVKVTLTAGKLLLSSEVAFDGGKQYGLQHMVVTLATTTEPRPDFVFSRMDVPLSGWTGRAILRTPREGERRIQFRWRTAGGSGESQSASAPRDLIPSYLLDTIARFLPRKKGSCLRFHPLMEGSGRVGLPSALYCAGRQVVPSAGKAASAWRFDWRTIGNQTSSSYFIDDEGRMLEADWGPGTKGVLGTRKTALEGVRPELAPTR